MKEEEKFSDEEIEELTKEQTDEEALSDYEADQEEFEADMFDHAIKWGI